MERRPQIPPPGLIYVEDTPDGPGIATRLGIRPGTYRRWRMQGTGPHAWKIGKRVVSRPELVDAYLRGLEHGGQTRAAA
ncbi:hypothetical protein [Streptomyces sp. NPDC088923]|uniref:hypothetical protein n=1 Tax=Streptomyces sp. NPDC088923 TaxID=3365913 RepID=UPI003810CFFA